MAVSSQGMQDHVGAKSANWMASCVVNLVSNFPFPVRHNPGARLRLLSLRAVQEVYTNTRKYNSRAKINAGAFECVDIFSAFGIPEQHLDPRQLRSRQSQSDAYSKQTRILLKLV